MKVKLDNNFLAIVNVHTEAKNRHNPLIAKNGKITESEVIEEQKSTYNFQYIETKDGTILVYTEHLAEFVELLNCFVSGQLNIKKQYGFKYTNGGGFYASIKQKDEEKFLAFSIEDKEIFLDKYSCRVLSSKLSKIYAKCEFEFHFIN